MDIETLEREALQKPAEDRARLATVLLESLDKLPPQEVDRLWLEESACRAAQIDSGEVELIHSEEVDRKAAVIYNLHNFVSCLEGPSSRLRSKISRLAFERDGIIESNGSSSYLPP
jgi:hypothetical protein